ncbi:hypothetical protein PPL_08551 [Heterostelium album PN500]|uniref:Uncharacterized protein n=1 Tax=Heterostelium pallidum (strain ATCC 26659 / Pp 5 / PN500) TaxID=670386 RepID=D3BJ31_HETP5|nr:hypothetical protein PPL_08551 [Heterostelium album PN500]EFA77911.1 hypothetical protein PPL_08551 [Heterostelium album PN500]|eukprot:XP_020430039.1 hypothetical protein PPL_08551 [Heterostelium album PN500]
MIFLNSKMLYRNLTIGNQSSTDLISKFNNSQGVSSQQSANGTTFFGWSVYFGDHFDFIFEALNKKK